MCNKQSDGKWSRREEGKRRQQHIDDGAMNRETIDLLVATVVH